MKRLVKVDQHAKADIREAFDWYERRNPGSGHQFLFQVKQCLERVFANPTGYRLIYKSIRKAKLAKFPYNVYFEIRDEVVIIFACVHTSRSEQAWRSRLQ